MHNLNTFTAVLCLFVHFVQPTQNERKSQQTNIISHYLIK